MRGGQRAAGVEEVNEGWLKSWPEKVGLEKEGMGGQERAETLKDSVESLYIPDFDCG